MDREVEVLVPQEFESIEVLRGRVAHLGTSQVKADHALVTVTDREFSDLLRSGVLPHRREQCANADPTSRSLRVSLAHFDSLEHCLDYLLERKSPLNVQLGSVPYLGVHNTIFGEVFHALRGHSQERFARLHDAQCVRERLKVPLQRT